ncbi:WD repeat-containing protein 18 [Wyeomyia smithii]|uniref:WD repeat-containing protein 18 n=1 Tax=Wyeomyia smithii TaxID=174621 RepID=UPI002467F797|nr:WD repeat-containing protein 18 [Wyeomyia smithii]
MSDCVEIAITGDCSEQLWSCCVWDVRTGNHLLTYKANMVKPMLHIWPINRHEPISTRFVLPGRANAVAISPDGNYCLVAVQEIIYVYLMATGAMITTITRHYQVVTSICFTDNGSHFASAGQDGMVLVWNLSQIVRVFQKQTSKALYSFSDHVLPVTDLYIGRGGIKALLCSVSTDRSCKIYDLSSGCMLLNLIFQEPLASVIMNPLESSIFVGTNEGPIHVFNITLVPRSKDYHVIRKQHQKNIFVGHNKQVTCLSVSSNEEILLSGGADERVIVWHIKNRQQLRTIPHKGTITIARFLLTPKAMFNQEIKLNSPFQPFQKIVYPTDKIIDLSIEFNVIKNLSADVKTQNCTSNNPVGESSNFEEVSKLKREIQRLKMVNNEIYDFSVKHILKNNKGI